jgi:sRNA-binding regulator protein Hfq
VANRTTSGPQRPAEELPTQRKLIRPNLAEMADRYPTRSFQPRKQVPPEQTNAESYYYLKQMAAKTPMVVVLNDGTEVRGWIEWYDKHALKVNRDRGPNLMIPKRSIKYLFKQGDEGVGTREGNR